MRQPAQLTALLPASLQCVAPSPCSCLTLHDGRLAVIDMQRATSEQYHTGHRAIEPTTHGRRQAHRSVSSVAVLDCERYVECGVRLCVDPTPGSPSSTGLFLLRLLSISMVLLISSSLPMTGSSLPSLASSVRSRQYFFKFSPTGTALGSTHGRLLGGPPPPPRPPNEGKRRGEGRHEL